MYYCMATFYEDFVERPMKAKTKKKIYEDIEGLSYKLAKEVLEEVLKSLPERARVENDFN